MKLLRKTTLNPRLDRPGRNTVVDDDRPCRRSCFTPHGAPCRVDSANGQDLRLLSELTTEIADLHLDPCLGGSVLRNGRRARGNGRGVRLNVALILQVGDELDDLEMEFDRVHQRGQDGHDEVEVEDDGLPGFEYGGAEFSIELL